MTTGLLKTSSGRSRGSARRVTPPASLERYTPASTVSLPSRLWHQTSSWPTSVTLVCRCTGHHAAGLAFQGRRKPGSVPRCPAPTLRRRCPLDLRGEPTSRGSGKLHLLADHQAELLARNVGFGSFLHAEWGNAQSLHRPRHSGHGGHRGLDADVVRPGRAAADAHRPGRGAPGRSTPLRARPRDRDRCPCSVRTGLALGVLRPAVEHAR